MTDSRYGLPTPLDLFRRVDAQTVTHDYLDKQAIYSQGDKADAFFYIRSGHVKLTVTSKSGKKAVIAILKAGHFFGEGCLTKLSLRMSGATSIESSSVARVTRANMARVINQEPVVARLFISHLLLRIEQIEGGLADQMFSSSEKRLARILLIMAGCGGNAQPQPALLKVSQETLAEMVGTTRSRVSHFMNGFRKLGYIDYNGTIQVHPTLIAVIEDGPVTKA